MGNVRSRLLEAIQEGRRESLKQILDTHPELLNYQDDSFMAHKRTPLHYAVLHNQIEIVRFLIERGADVNAKTSFGYTPLHNAASRGSKDIVQLLIDAGADLNAKNDRGNTPLFRAIHYKHQDVVDLLKAKGAQSEGSNKYQFGDISKSVVKTVFAPKPIPTMEGSYRRVPGPPPRAIVGNLPDVTPFFVRSCRRLYREYGKIVRLWLLGNPFFVVTAPEYLEPILAVPDKKIPRQELAPDGLFLADGKKWSFARSTLQSCFTERTMDKFIPVFVEKGKILLNSIDSKKGESVELFHMMEKLLFDVICTAGFNYKCDILTSGVKPKFVESFDYLFQQQKSRAVSGILKFIPTPSNLEFHSRLKELNDAVDEIVSSTPSPERNDLLKLMVEATHPETGEKLDQENLRHQAITLLVAGHKTTVLLLVWTLYQLSQHPEVEAKLIEELQSVFGDKDFAPTTADLKKLRYMEQVMRETLRMYPPAQSIVRGLNDDLVVDGYLLPKNSNVLINVYDLHRDPKYWSNPEIFDPSRFSKENFEKLHTYQYIPFGGGPRHCIGNLFAFSEVKIFLSLIYRRFVPRIDVDHTILIGGNPLEPLQDIKMHFYSKEQNVSLKLSNTLMKSRIETVNEEQWNLNRQKSHNLLINVLYGSNQGTCREYAMSIGKEAEMNGFTASVTALDDFKFDSIEKEQNNNNKEPSIWVIVCSSYNGLPPNNAVKFVNWISKAHPKTLLQNKVKFAVFGCGNRQWHTTYQKVPRIIDQRLEELGAQRLYPLGVGDEDSDMETDFSSWKKLLWPVFSAEFSVFLPSNYAEQTPSKPHFEMEILKEVQNRKASRWIPEGFFNCQVLVNRELQSEESDRSTCHIELGWNSNENSLFSYQPGDHLEVYPSNQPDVVANIASRFGLDLKTEFRLSKAISLTASSVIDLPAWADKDLTVEEVLTHYVDLTSMPSRNVLEALSQYAKDSEEKARLAILGSSFSETFETYQELIIKNGMTIGEILENFKSVDIPFAHFLEIVPALKPRYYSISSTPEAHPGSLHLTVGVVEFTTPTQRLHKGVCSYHLSSLQPGDSVLCKVQPSIFRPSDPTTPTICVANGTGIAPFRAFIEHRSSESDKQVEPITLFFGCRSRALDHLYEDEFQKYIKSGTLVLHSAFSRDQKEKIYVQHKILEAKQEVVKKLLDQKGVLFVCGSRAMANEVENALKQAIQQVTGKNSDETKSVIEELQASGRYHLDVWG